MVITWLKYLTFLSLSAIAELEEKTKTEPEKKHAQIALARELTTLVHGKEALDRAEAATRALFGSEITSLDYSTLSEVFSEAPATTISSARIQAGIPLVDLLAETGLFQSKGAARKEIPAGGVYLNNERVTDAAFTVGNANLISGKALVLRKGKKTYHLVRIES